MTPLRSIILIYYREPDFLLKTVEALEQEFTNQEETEILLVDNASGDGVATRIAQSHPRISLISSPENLFYGKGANLAMQQARGEWLLVMNIDVEWEVGALRSFVASAETDERIAIAGPLVRYRDGRVQVTAHRRFPTWWTVCIDYCLPLQQLFMRSARHPYQLSPTEHAHRRAVAHLTGVCLYVRRSAYDQVGGFDPHYTMYLEETDWQRRLTEAGLAVWLIPEGSIVHFGSAEKTFAQASANYLTSQVLYGQRWWRGPLIILRLQILWWTAWLVSTLFLLLAAVATAFSPRKASRIWHYLRSYQQLARNLIHFTPPHS